MKLHELILAVKEKNLSKEQLEDYSDQMSNLFAEMMLELADVEKEKAIYFEDKKNFSVGGLKAITTDISIKRQWQITEKGLREIVLKRYLLATKELINSLKSRTYRLIY